MISNKAKSIAAVSQLRAWLKLRPSIPIYHGRVNKTKICQIIGVPVSTLRTNKGLAEILNQLAADHVSKSPETPKAKKVRSSIAPLLNTIEEQQQEIDRLRRKIASSQFLISTGISLT